jgi:hypothetical protein
LATGSTAPLATGVSSASLGLTVIIGGVVEVVEATVSASGFSLIKVVPS